jgi:hypothetical protein
MSLLFFIITQSQQENFLDIGFFLNERKKIVAKFLRVTPA